MQEPLLHRACSGLRLRILGKTSQAKLDLDFAGRLQYKQWRLYVEGSAFRGLFASVGMAAGGDLKPFRHCKPLLQGPSLRPAKLTATLFLHAPGQP